MPNTEDARPLPALIQSLHDNPPFPHPCHAVEIVETHISWTLLTGDYAYKILKPVDLGFLDFSSLENRKHYNNEALRLNRRHAPEIYLDVVRINGTETVPAINTDGPVLEYALRMRQFDRNKELDKLAERHELTSPMMDNLARTVAALHEQADIVPPGSDAGSGMAVQAPVTNNLATLEAQFHNDADSLASITQLRQWSSTEYEKLTSAFNERKIQGRVRECHGDMHLGNIVLIDDQPVLFDCIEFSEQLRWIDVISDLAFLIMDLHEHNYPGYAWRLLNDWLELTGDYRGLAVLRYYLVYRALVRAMVAGIRLQEGDYNNSRGIGEQRRYMALAETFTQSPRPLLFITLGVSGSGKSFISQALLQHRGAIRVRSDVERKRLAGLALNEPSGSSIDGGIYTAEHTRKTYQQLLDLSRAILKAGYSVIADATFLKAGARRGFIELAGELNVPLVILDCYASDATLRERVRSRASAGTDASEADTPVLDHQLQARESLDDHEQMYRIGIDTDQCLDMEQLNKRIDRLL